MKNIRRSAIALFTTVIMAVSGAAAVPASAAGSSLPSGTTTAYTISDGRVNTYTSGGSYTGYIDGKTDQCKILSFNSGSGRVKVSYPTSKGSKTAYTSLGNFIHNTNFSRYYTKTTSNVAVYTKPNMSKKIGTVYSSDNTLVVSTKSNLSQIIYPISGGYKMGWIYSSQLKSNNTNIGKTYYVTTKAGLILRSKASTSSTALTTMPYGSSITVYSISNGWASCKYGNKTGYCSASYISTSKPNNNNTDTGRVNLSKALYNNNGAYITCGFDGYTSTSGRHEGIDIKYKNGAPVYSLTDGIVVRVANGYNGSKGLSTIAIYNSSTNKTVIYLHSAPVSGLKAGKTIKKGQKIATEAWRGISSSSASHTHVEVRNGKQGYASVSVGDPVLNNFNPTAFWNSMGYNIK